MHQKPLLIAVMLILSMTLCSCTNNNSSNNKNDGLISEQDTAAQMTFEYIINPKQVSHNTYKIYMPGDWNEVSVNGALVYLPEESELMDVYSEKIAIAVTFLEENDKRDLESLISDNEGQMRSIVKNLDIYSRESFRLGPLDGTLMKGRYSIMNTTIELTKIAALQGNRFYRFEITCTGTPCKYTNTYYEMAKSFEPKEFEPKK